MVTLSNGQLKDHDDLTSVDHLTEGVSPARRIELTHVHFTDLNQLIRLAAGSVQHRPQWRHREGLRWEEC